MSVQKVNVLVPPLRAVPPAAAWIGSVVSGLFGGDDRIRTGFPAWLEAVRAKRAIERAARQDARSRMELMALARRYESTQPEFAKDLYAAARSDCVYAAVATK